MTFWICFSLSQAETPSDSSRSCNFLATHAGRPMHCKGARPEDRAASQSFRRCCGLASVPVTPSACRPQTNRLATTLVSCCLSPPLVAVEEQGCKQEEEFAAAAERWPRTGVVYLVSRHSSHLLSPFQVTGKLVIKTSLRFDCFSSFDC